MFLGGSAHLPFYALPGDIILLGACFALTGNSWCEKQLLRATDGGLWGQRRRHLFSDWHAQFLLGRDLTLVWTAPPAPADRFYQLRIPIAEAAGHAYSGHVGLDYFVNLAYDYTNYYRRTHNIAMRHGAFLTVGIRSQRYIGR